VPAALALAGWGFVYITADPLYIAVGLATLAAGVVAFLFWAKASATWPFGRPFPEDSSHDPTATRTR
jgi:hypothetical protein